jgi:signal transduction histidine kinase
MIGFEGARHARWSGETRPFSAVRALAITALSMVLSEIVAMGVIPLFALSSPVEEALVDAAIMIGLGFPVLYALSFRPLAQLAESRARAQASLKAANAELEAANRAERRARDAAETIRSAAVEMTQAHDLDATVAAMLEHLDALMAFDRARVMVSEGGSRLRTVATFRRGRALEILDPPPPSFDAAADPVLGELLAQGQGRVIPDIHLHPAWGPRVRPEFEHSWMGVPLLSAGKTVGLYSVSRAAPNAFDQTHLRLARALSAPAAVAIENATLFQELTSERERLQTLSRKLVDLQENERRAIARELHDETGQTLTSLKLGLRLLEQTSGDPRTSSRAAELRRVADDVQEGLHRLAANLRPPALEHVGLVAALGQLAVDLSESSGIRIDVETVGCDEERLPWRVETDLFRIAQEAVTNALRHAEADEISVVLDRREGRLRLVVEDDGRGFDPVEASRSDRLGLVGMRERADILGGTLTVESRPGSGTTIVVEAPVGG